MEEKRMQNIKDNKDEKRNCPNCKSYNVGRWINFCRDCGTTWSNHLKPKTND